MTATGAVLFLLVFAVLYAMRETFWVAPRTCRYCGEVGTHDPHCPYANIQ